MNIIIVFALVLAAGLLGYFGFVTIKAETTPSGRVATAVGMTFFVVSLIYLAYKVYVSPLP